MIIHRKYVSYSLLFIILATISGCQYPANNDSVSNPPPNTVTIEPEPAPTTPSAALNPVSEPVVQPINTTINNEIDSNKSISWWFTRNQQHLTPAMNQSTVKLVQEYNAFYVLPNNEKKIYLTFDEGYELGYTPKILDILDRQQVKAAFFITGQFIKTQPDLVKRMQASGHLVCNHTWNHPDLTTVSADKFYQEINSVEQKFTELTGTQMPRYLRPPMGNYSPTSLKLAASMGYRTVFWSIAFQDWDPNKQPGAEYSHKHVLDNIHPGAVILLHAVSQSNTEALENIIIDLRAQGYVFSTFDSL